MRWCKWWTHWSHKSGLSVRIASTQQVHWQEKLIVICNIQNISRVRRKQMLSKGQLTVLGFILKINWVTSINLIAEVTALGVLFLYWNRAWVGKQRTYWIQFPGATAEERGTIHLVKNNKVEMETSIGKVVGYER